MSIRLGTRKSQLALWQAHHTADLLSKITSRQVDIVGLSTLGDNVQNVPLSEFKQTGVFTKELDRALLDNKIDIAVHCVKDLPTVLPDGLRIVAYLQRAETEDAVILHAKHADLAKQAKAEGKHPLSLLPKGSVIGTSALRRRAVISKWFSHLECKDVRGNVNTRLAKLDRGEYDALILAVVGLKRLKFEDRISTSLSAEVYGQAVGQGALAIVCRNNDDVHQKLCYQLDDVATRSACTAERAMLRKLEGGCKVPVTTFSKITVDGDKARLFLRGTVLTLDGNTEVKEEFTQEFSLKNGINNADALEEDDKKLIEDMIAVQSPESRVVDEASARVGVHVGAQLVNGGGKIIIDNIKKQLREFLAPR